ncbi:MAG: UvrB/UvrC motif-containing protein [Methanothrix sp.]|nr:UvrB/UvrC motif-containing protein [Methanothrix sp.]
MALIRPGCTRVIIELEAERREAAERLGFKRAIQLWDTVRRLEKEMKVGRETKQNERI